MKRMKGFLAAFLIVPLLAMAVLPAPAPADEGRGRAFALGLGTGVLAGLVAPHLFSPPAQTVVVQPAPVVVQPAPVIVQPVPVVTEIWVSGYYPTWFLPPVDVIQVQVIDGRWFAPGHPGFIPPGHLKRMKFRHF